MPSVDEFLQLAQQVVRAAQLVEPSTPSDTDRQVQYRRCDSSMSDSTWLQGYVDVRFAKLVETLGPPDDKGPDSPACWTLQFHDGTIATVYVYKPGQFGYGVNEIPTDDYCWHVGGRGIEAVYHVARLFQVQPLLDITRLMLHEDEPFEP